MDTFYLHFLVSHHDHDHESRPSSSTSIPFNPITCMLLPYPALLALYDTNVPRLVNSSVSQHCPPYSTLLSHFLSTPPPLTFLRHFSFLLMTSFSAFFFVFIISESPVHEGLFLPVSLSTDAHRSTVVPLPVSNVSCCISSHLTYPHRHLIKLFSPLLS
jgi:hypothetical protein